MKEEYKNYNVGDLLVIVNNPDNPPQNGSFVKVDRFTGNVMYCLLDGEIVPFRVTTFRRPTKLELALK